MIYFEALDTVIACVKSRFNQRGLQMYHKLEQLLMGSGEQDNICHEVCTFHSNDLDKDLATTNTASSFFILIIQFPRIQMYMTIKTVQGMSVADGAMFGELIKLVSLIVVIPATNAVSKRYFFAMHCVKTYLRSVMSQERLNSLMVLHIHKDLTDDLDLKVIGNEFHAK